jgi:hypothetical protein
MTQPRGALIQFQPLVGDGGEQRVLFPCRPVYDIFETDPWPSARERRAMVGCVTYALLC